MRTLFILLSLLLLVGSATAQAPAPTPQVHGTLLQVMRGILYPNSNLIFDVQTQDPEAPAQENPLSAGPHRPFDGQYGGWEAVENSSIALAEAANLLIIPGRRCANGRPVPLDQADWREWVQGLRDAGMSAYRAAQSKSQDAIVEAADQVAVACANCHDKYRDVDGGIAARCMP